MLQEQHGILWPHVEPLSLESLVVQLAMQLAFQNAHSIRWHGFHVMYVQDRGIAGLQATQAPIHIPAETDLLSPSGAAYHVEPHGLLSN